MKPRLALKSLNPVAVILLGCTIPTTTAIRSATCGRWAHVKTAVVKGKQLSFSQITALSPTNAWAVGASNANGNLQPVIEHWNGRLWSLSPAKPVPGGGSLTTVAAISASDIWVAGDSTIYGGPGSSTIAEHWNGSRWQLITTPHVYTGGAPMIASLVAINSTSVWAVGSIDNSGSYYQPFSERWNGSKWTMAFMPNKGRRGVAISGAAEAGGSIWAVGGTSPIFESPGKAAIEVRSGGRWRMAPTPTYAGVTLTSASALGPSNVWAVGETGNTKSWGYFAAHWNGKVWTVSSPLPKGPLPASTLSSVAMLSPTSGWAVGYSARGGTFDGAILHWNGSRWMRSSFPATPNATLLLGVAADGSGGAWAVGLGGQAASGSALALHIGTCRR
jgi:hypothetical protein